MKRLAALGAWLFLLGGCALPVPVQIASWALDGLSYLMTEKSATDHGISVLAQKDCAVLRVLWEPDEVCREFDDSATVLADGRSYDFLFSEDEILNAEAAALAEFETASRGDETDPTPVPETAVTRIDMASHMPEVGALTTARAIIEDSVEEDSVEEVASLVSAALFFDGPISLDAFPQQTVAHVRTLADILKSQQARLGDVEDLGPYSGGNVAKAWTAKSTQVLETGLEPAVGFYFVIGSFRDHTNAHKLRSQYRGLTPSVLAAKLEEITLYRVVVGPFTKTEEQVVQKNIFQAGIADSWAIQVKPGDWKMAMVDPAAAAPVEVADMARLEDMRDWNAMGYTQMLSRLVY